MKPTLSEDGLLRANISVKVRISEGDIVDAYCAWFCRKHDNLADSPDAAAQVKAVLKREGRSKILRAVKS